MRELLTLLPRPSRYTGIEEGSVHKNREDVTIHCALAFPDMYEVGMSYLGQKIIYGILNQRQDIWAERVFTPCREGGDLLRKHNVLLATMESDTPLRDLHLVGFSITHELCYTNVLYMLDLAGIPLRAADRGDDLTRWPVIMAGGGCTLAAEPLAPFMDLMVLGEGEEVMVELLDLLAKARSQGWTRARFHAEASHIPGVYVPAHFSVDKATGKVVPLTDVTRVTRRIVPDMDKAVYPPSQIVPFGAVHNRLSLEIGRGCTRGCRFCQAGITYRPCRERSVENLQELLEGCLAQTGYDDVSFLSLSTGDFSALKRLFMTTVDRCAQEQVSVSLPSLRVGSIDDAIMHRMAGIRRTGATLAPEAGSQRMRDVINKGVTEEGLLLHVRKLFEHGWQQVKLYFMIGLPTETYEDLDAIVDLCRKVRDAAGRGGKRLMVTASVSPFVPKPHTPFQWEPQIEHAEIRARIGYLIDAFRREKSMKLRWHEADMSHLEGILSRGDRRLADVVETAYRKGAIFSSWVEGFQLAPWLEAMAEHGLTPATYCGERDTSAPLPWDHLDCGVSNEFLLRERERAYALKITDDCRYGACRMCGVCDTKASPSRLDKLPAGDDYRNRLNQNERDQESHQPALDEEGRIIRIEAPSGPPKLSPELAVKAGQYRVWYAKDGPSVFLSQLELQSLFERAMRRAGLPMAFSQGFHPLPLLSFGRALPVGVASRAEWFAITLREHLPAQEVCNRLRNRFPRGMNVLFVEELKRAKHVPQPVREVFQVRCLRQGYTGTFTAAWKDFAAKEHVEWTRDTKRGERTSDIRPLCKDIAFNDDGTLTITFDWADLYISPLSVCRVVTPDLGAHELHLTKTEQQFD